MLKFGVFRCIALICAKVKYEGVSDGEREKKTDTVESICISAALTADGDVTPPTYFVFTVMLRYAIPDKQFGCLTSSPQFSETRIEHPFFRCAFVSRHHIDDHNRRVTATKAENDIY